MSFDPEMFGQAMGEQIQKTVAPLLARIEALEKQLDDMPTPQDGNSFTLDDAQPVIDKAVNSIIDEVEKNLNDAVEAAVANIPVPKDGQDGKSMVDFLINREGELIGTYSDGEHKNFGRVIGQDGKDGLSLESFEMEYDDEAKELVFKAGVGQRTKEARFPARLMEAQGYWREGNKAQAGDGWTHEGSFWIAKRNTSTAPSTKSDDWMLAVRRGRDGENVVKRVNVGPAKPIKLGGDDASND